MFADICHALARGSPFVQADTDADVAITLAFGGAVGWDFAQRTPFEVGQLQVLEHDINQFLERDVGFVIIDSRTVACAAVTFVLTFLAGLADDLARPRFAIALPDTGAILAIYEAVFLDPP